MPATIRAETAPQTQNELTRCMPRSQMAAELGNRFGEYKFGGGISMDGTLIELFAGNAGSFTILKTVPTGLSCIVDFGGGWQRVRPPGATVTRDQGKVTDRMETY